MQFSVQGTELQGSFTTFVNSVDLPVKYMPHFHPQLCSPSAKEKSSVIELLNIPNYFE